MAFNKEELSPNEARKLNNEVNKIWRNRKFNASRFTGKKKVLKVSGFEKAKREQRGEDTSRTTYYR